MPRAAPQRSRFARAHRRRQRRAGLAARAEPRSRRSHLASGLVERCLGHLVDRTADHAATLRGCGFPLGGCFLSELPSLAGGRLECACAHLDSHRQPRRLSRWSSPVHGAAVRALRSSSIRTRHMNSTAPILPSGCEPASSIPSTPPAESMAALIPPRATMRSRAFRNGWRDNLAKTPRRMFGAAARYRTGRSYLPAMQVAPSPAPAMTMMIPHRCD